MVEQLDVFSHKQSQVCNLLDLGRCVTSIPCYCLQELEAATASLEAAKAALEAEKAALEAAKKALEDEKAALEAAKAALESEKRKLEGEKSDLEKAKSSLEVRCVTCACHRVVIPSLTEVIVDCNFMHPVT
jgi:predicted nuclease with TOPRIM domain